MITIADYIFHLLNGLAEARRMSDYESLRVAQAYADNDMLRHFPAPRFRLSEVELSIPLAVSDTEMEDKLSFALSEQNFLYTVKKEVDQQIGRVYGDVQIGTAGVANIYPVISDWYKDLTGCKTWGDFDRSFDQYFAKITDEIQISAASLRSAAAPEQAAPLAAISPINIYEILKRRFKVTQSLKNVMIDPQSTAVSRFDNGHSLVIIKAKINEEGVMVSSMTDETGQKRYSVNFE